MVLTVRFEFLRKFREDYFNGDCGNRMELGVNWTYIMSGQYAHSDFQGHVHSKIQEEIGRMPCLKHKMAKAQFSGVVWHLPSYPKALLFCFFPPARQKDPPVATGAEDVFWGCKSWHHDHG